MCVCCSREFSTGHQNDTGRRAGTNFCLLLMEGCWKNRSSNINMNCSVQFLIEWLKYVDICDCELLYTWVILTVGRYETIPASGRQCLPKGEWKGFMKESRRGSWTILPLGEEESREMERRLETVRSVRQGGKTFPLLFVSGDRFRIQVFPTLWLPLVSLLLSHQPLIKAVIQKATLCWLHGDN